MNTPSIAEMERAVGRRDASYDGIFLVAVKTTGIFCRPSCPSRPARPENRRYFTNARAAQAAGFRPCKRCRPMDNWQHPAWVNTLLATLASSPDKRLPDGVMRRLGIDPVRARRYFLKHYGMSFQMYCRRQKMGEALIDIRRGSDISNVVFEHGYQSDSGFREAFRKTFGGPPGKSRQSNCIIVDWVFSPLGPLVIAACDTGVCLLEFARGRGMGSDLAPVAYELNATVVPGRHPYLDQLKTELREYFAGEREEFTVPLVYPGTPFQRAAWDQLRRIPYGTTISYAEEARRMGMPRAQRAVGRANGQNRLAILVPCHRVVNKSGRLGGYGGGLWRKQFLLDLEQGPGLYPLANGNGQSN
jgi:AraC family transcriptional regulator of adaptative response/methylated-DNA-[protein]-cysteine methyltransferase